MNYTDFKKSIDKGEYKSIYLFEGEDVFFANRGLALLKDKLISEPDLNLKVFSDGVLENELASSLDSFPFMSEYRLTVVKEFYPDKNFLKGKIKGYLSNPYPNSVLVIQNIKPCDALKKLDTVCVVDCSKADAGLLSKWIKAEGFKNGVEFTDKAVGMLIEYCLSDMTRINTETHKLISYALKTGVVNEDDVDLLVSKDTEYKIYQLTDFIGKRQFEDAIKIISELISKGETEQRLIVSMYNYFRRLLHVAISDKSNFELSKLIGVQEFAIQKLKRQASMFKKKALKTAVDVLSDADYFVKSGVMGESTAMWLSLFKIITD